jgi:hypothetical protein
MNLQQYQEDTLKKFDDTFADYFIVKTGILEDHKGAIKAFLLSSLKGQLENIEGIIKKERDTWARESIGDKALQSLESALQTKILTH